MVYDPSREFLQVEEQKYPTTQGLFEFVVRIFISHVEDLIARGILKGYRIRIDDPNAIKGKLLITETIHRRPIVRDRHWCSYSQFTANILENIIIRSTAQILQAYRYREAYLQDRIRRVGRALGQVSIELEPRMKFQELEFNRLNEPYRPALFLAKLLLDHIMFSGSEGEEPFLAFLIDMNWLFEKVVWTIINQHSSDLGVTAREQKYYPLDKASLVKVQPDVILYHQNLPALILDAKYKLDPNRADVYQVLAYCHALGLNRAILVHPEGEQIPTRQLLIREPGEFKISYLSIDLSVDPSDIEEAIRGFIEEVRKILLPIKSSYSSSAERD